MRNRERERERDRDRERERERAPIAITSRDARPRAARTCVMAAAANQRRTSRTAPPVLAPTLVPATRSNRSSHLRRSIVHAAKSPLLRVRRADGTTRDTRSSEFLHASSHAANAETHIADTGRICAGSNQYGGGRLSGLSNVSRPLSPTHTPDAHASISNDSRRRESLGRSSLRTHRIIDGMEKRCWEICSAVSHVFPWQLLATSRRDTPTERERERERDGVCVCVFVCEREREI